MKFEKLILFLRLFSLFSRVLVLPHVATVSSRCFCFTSRSHFKFNVGHFKWTVVLPGVLGLTLYPQFLPSFLDAYSYPSLTPQLSQQSLLPSSCLPDRSFLLLHGEDGKLPPLWLGMIYPRFLSKAISSSPCALDPTPRLHSGMCQ